ncbi:LysM peptidoglycan-binding domain-containing protein [Facklamia sp. P9177]|uniref:LysM peptidoglycan-binding domain-containing protein n=1 Tax=Facklamia sp. P9177 TaxID=3421945 RepID=UPI003D16FA0C
MMNREQFIEMVAGLVEKYSSPIFNSVRIAQACLESNYGQSDLAKNGKNLFGIKASYPWAGELYTKITKEEVTGKLIKVPGDFRKYASWELSVKDHASFFTSTDYRKNVAYKDVLSAKTPEQQARALAGTYATDSTYGVKLINLINEYDLKQYDKEKMPMTVKYPKPRIIDRTKQALGYPGHGVYPKRSLHKIKYIIRHYTATKNEGYGAEVIRNHENYWRNHHGWNLGGYHYFIDRAGNIFQNYDLSIVSYGAGAVNPESVHISREASSKYNYTKAQDQAEQDLILWLLTNPLKHLSGNSIKGHKEFMQTSCPGYSISELAQYRKFIAEKLDSNWGDFTNQNVTASKSGVYVVKHGDTLWAIAKAHGKTVDQLREWNGIQKGEWLKTGQELKVTDENVEYYTVKKGDTLWQIANDFNLTVKQLIDWNNLKSNLIIVGQNLLIKEPEHKDVPLAPTEDTKPTEEKPVDKVDDPKEEAIELEADEELRVTKDGKIRIVKIG